MSIEIDFNQYAKVKYKVTLTVEYDSNPLSMTKILSKDEMMNFRNMVHNLLLDLNQELNTW